MNERTTARGAIPMPAWVLVTLAALLTATSLTSVSSAALLIDAKTVAGNAFTTGAVQLSDDDSGSALFTLTDLARGDSGNGCVVVQYDGNLASDVKLYHQSGSGTLGDHLELTVEQGSGATCAAFTGTTIYDGTLSGLATTHSDFASGIGTFSPTANGQSAVFRFTYTIPLDAPPSAASSTAGATFQWEARAT